MTDLSTLPLREAISAGEFPRALALWNAHVTRFADAMQQGEVTLGQWRELGEFVTWARQAALTSRAYAHDQLQSLHVSNQYGEPTPPQRPRMIQTVL